MNYIKHAILLISVLYSVSLAALPDDIMVEQYVDGLEFPVAMSVMPDGRLLVTEKAGTLRLVDHESINETPVLTVKPATKNEAGLIGVQVLPDFETSREFVIIYTPEDNLEQIYLSKFKLEDDDTATEIADPWLMLPSRPVADRHFGGNVKFHNDQMYIGISDLDKDDLAQDITSPAGSILRYNLDLSIPADNPFPDNPIFAYGLRNTFDFDIASDGTVWGGENGHHQHDEVNRIIAGGNYGFPLVLGFCDGYPIVESCQDVEDLVEPLYEFKYRTAPTGVLFYEGDLMPQLQGNLFIGGWHTGELHRFEIDGDDVIQNGQFFVPPEGVYQSFPGDDRQHLQAFGIVDAVEAADGSMLVLMSGFEVGKIYRLAPESEMLNPDAVRSEGVGRAEVDVPFCNMSIRQVGSLSAFLVVLFVVVIRVFRRRKKSAASVMIVLLLASSSASALDVNYGVKAGVNWSTVFGDNTRFVDPLLGSTVGLAARAPLFRYLDVSADLLYSAKGASNQNTLNRAVLHILSLPLTVAGRLPIGKTTLRLQGGVAPGWVFAATSASQDISGILKPLDFAWTGGLGAEFDLTDYILILDSRVEASTHNIYRASATPDALSTPTLFHAALTFTAGFLF